MLKNIKDYDRLIIDFPLGLKTIRYFLCNLKYDDLLYLKQIFLLINEKEFCSEIIKKQIVNNSELLLDISQIRINIVSSQELLDILDIYKDKFINKKENNYDINNINNSSNNSNN